jgi:branched-chain amino acid transport system ATP-binding protein
MTVILEIDGLSISFGGLKAVDNVTLAARTGEILSVIGPNGAGKTTLFNLISGVYKPQSGSVILEGKDVTGLAPDKLAGMGLTRTFQNLQIFQNMTALENVMVGRHLHEKRNVLAHLLALPSVRRQREESHARAMAPSNGWKSPAHWRWNRKFFCWMSLPLDATRAKPKKLTRSSAKSQLTGWP